MEAYTLYIDESETFNAAGDKYFVMSGVIIKNSEYCHVEDKVKRVKRKLWNHAPGCEQYILHEKDVSFASNRLNSRRLNTIPSCYHIFQKKENTVLLYNELSALFKQAGLITIGVGLDKTALYKKYGKLYLSNQLAIAIQQLVEHYCQFLIKRFAVGDICYEAMQPEQNAKIQQRIYELKALGTMYYSPKTIQNHLQNIKFVAKTENLIGLQLADFVPNTLGRYAAAMKPKNRNFARSIRRNLYDGDGDDQYKFGFKLLG